MKSSSAKFILTLFVALLTCWSTSGSAVSAFVPFSESESEAKDQSLEEVFYNNSQLSKTVRLKYAPRPLVPLKTAARQAPQKLLKPLVPPVTSLHLVHRPPLRAPPKYVTHQFIELL